MASNTGLNKSLLPAKNHSYEGPRTYSQIIDFIVRDLALRGRPRSKKFVADVIFEFFNKGTFFKLFSGKKTIKIKGFGTFIYKPPTGYKKPNKLTLELNKKFHELSVKASTDTKAKIKRIKEEKKLAEKREKEAREREKAKKEQDKSLNNSYFFY